MISEPEYRIFAELCEDLHDDVGLASRVMRLEMISYAQFDARLELLLRAFINLDGEEAAEACEELADYCSEMMHRIQDDIPDFDTDDMQLILSGIRARIEGSVY